MKKLIFLLLIIINSSNRIYSMNEVEKTFMYNIASGNLEVVSKLRPIIKNMNFKNEYGHTPLMQAAYYGRADIIDFLLKTEVDPNIQILDARNAWQNWTALTFAIDDDWKKVVEILLKYGANPYLQDHNGDTALFKAIKKNKLDIVEILLKYGTDPAIKNQFNKTALEEAISQGKNEIAKIIQKYIDQYNDFKEKVTKGKIEVILKTMDNILLRDLSLITSTYIDIEQPSYTEFAKQQLLKKENEK